MNNSYIYPQTPSKICEHCNSTLRLNMLINICDKTLKLKRRPQNIEQLERRTTYYYFLMEKIFIQQHT